MVDGWPDHLTRREGERVERVREGEGERRGEKCIESEERVWESEERGGGWGEKRVGGGGGGGRGWGEERVGEVEEVGE